MFFFLDLEVKNYKVKKILGNLSKKPDIYVSYLQSGSQFENDKSYEVFKRIYQFFHKRKYNIIANTSIAYKESIHEFIRRMGSSEYIIIIISDAYLKSASSMGEVLEMIKYPDFYDRIFPVVLSDAKINDALEIISYVEFWEAKIKLLHEKVKQLNTLTDIEPVNRDINLYSEIRKNIVSFAASVTDMNPVRAGKTINILPLAQKIEQSIKADQKKNRKATGSVWYVSALFIVILGAATFIFFKTPANVTFWADSNVNLVVDNKYNLILGHDSALTITLSRGSYVIVGSDNNNYIRDTLKATIDLFWRNYFFEIRILDKIDSYDFKLAQASGRIDKLEAYCIKHPFGKYVEIAQLQIDMLKNETSNRSIDTEQKAYLAAVALSTEKSFSEFLTVYPNGKYTLLVQKQLSVLKKGNKSDADQDSKTFIEAQNAGTVEAYQKYLNMFPNGKFSITAREKLEKLTFKPPRINDEEEFSIALEKNTIQAYNLYLQKFPDGRYKKRAADNIGAIRDEKAYTEALAINKIRAYEMYLLSFPNGLYVPGAKNMIQGLSMNQIQGMTLINGGDYIFNSKNVKISSFYIDRREVTVGEYRKYCESNNIAMPDAPPWGWNDEHPMVLVSWYDAQAYAKSVGKRLPTEAEWEYASFISNKNRNLVSWNLNNSGNRVQAAGIKQVSDKGLYDVLGNVSEWCFDWYLSNYPTSDGLLNPSGPINGTQKVQKGGSWKTPAGSLKTTNRYFENPDKKLNYIGFRCVTD